MSADNSDQLIRLGVGQKVKPRARTDDSSFLEPLTSKPTRITTNTATLINNIFTNVFNNKATCVNGLLCTDISDHIPIFHIHEMNMK